MSEPNVSKFTSVQLLRKPGDRILSVDWNTLVSEIERLGVTKADKDTDKEEHTFQGPLTIEGALQLNGDLNLTGTVKATRFEGDGSGLTGINAGSENGASKWAEGTEGAIYYSRGNVGIGIDQPSSKLEVTGTVKATRFEGDGSGLTGISADGGNGAGSENWIEGTEGAIYYGNGSVGIGIDKPGAELDIAGKADDSAQTSLQVRSGNTSNSFSSNQITLAYNNTGQYRHVIKTRHHSGKQTGNAIDFYVWKHLSEDEKDDPEAIGTLHSMTLNGGNVGIGTTGPEAKLQIINAAQNANGNTLVLGPTNAANLRLGYDKNYSWIQSHGSKPLAINPIGNNVGIGTDKPGATLEVNGGIKSPSLQSIYVQPKNWENKNTDGQWQVVLSHTLTPAAAAYASIITNGHGWTADTNKPLDVAIFINDKIFSDRNDGFGFGMGILHVENRWMPVQAIASVRLEAKKKCTLEARIRARGGGDSQLNGPAMIILLTGS